MQTRPQTASPMEELGGAHQLEIQILNLKNLGYTIVRGAIPPNMLKEIQNAFDKKMNEQIGVWGGISATHSTAST